MTNINSAFAVDYSATGSKKAMLLAGTSGSGIIEKIVSGDITFEGDIIYIFSDRTDYDKAQGFSAKLPNLKLINSIPRDGVSFTGANGYGGDDAAGIRGYTEITEPQLVEMVTNEKNEPEYSVVFVYGNFEGATLGSTVSLMLQTLEECGIPISFAVSTLNKYGMVSATEEMEGRARLDAKNICEAISQDGYSVAVFDGHEVVKYFEEVGRTDSISQSGVLNTLDLRVIDILKELMDKTDLIVRPGSKVIGNINNTDIVTSMRQGGYMVPIAAFSKEASVGEIVRQIDHQNFILPKLVKGGTYTSHKAFLFIEGEDVQEEALRTIKMAFRRLGIYSNDTKLKERQEIIEGCGYLKVVAIFPSLQESSVMNRVTDKKADNTEMSIAQMQAEIDRLKAAQEPAPEPSLSEILGRSYSSYMSPAKSNEGIMSSKNTDLTPDIKLKLIQERAINGIFN